MSEFRVTPTKNYTNYEDKAGFVPRVNAGAPKDEPEGEKPPAWDVVKAGFSKYNPAVAAARNAYTEKEYSSEVEPGWSPYSPEERESIKDYPPEIFKFAKSPEDRDRLKYRYDKAREDNKTLESAGALGVLSSIGGGATNPLYLIPVFGWGVRGATFGSNFTRSAMSGLAGEAATEGVFHAGVDPTRTATESMINIASGSLVSGLVGGLVPSGSMAGIEKEVVDHLSALEEVNRPRWKVTTGEDGKPVWSTNEAKPAGAGRYDTEGNRMETLADQPPLPRLQKLSAILSKLTPARLLASPVGVVRTLATELAEQNIFGTRGAAIETVIKVHDGTIADTFHKARESFDKIRKTTPGMSYSKFQEEVVTALRNGDAHQIPEIAEIAKRIRTDIIDVLTKKAQDAKLLPQDIKVKFAKTYFPRMYNYARINSDRALFIEQIANVIEKTQPNVSREIAIREARGVLSQITGTDPRGIGKKKEFKSVTGALKSRTLAIDDNDLAPWLINDFEYVLPHWTRLMAAQSEIAQRFGGGERGLSMTDQLNEIREAWDEVIAGASSPKQAAKYSKQMTDEIRTLEALRDRLLGHYGLPENYDSFFVRAGRGARNLNVLSKLGGMTISSISDLARPIFTHGMKPYAKVISKLLTSPELRALNKAEMRRMGVATDMILNQRLRAITEMDYTAPGTHTVGEQILEDLSLGRGYGSKGVPDFSKLTLMSQWNQMAKGISGLLSSDQLLRKMVDPRRHKSALARGGIAEEMAERIHKEFTKHGDSQDGLNISNAYKWTDIEAKEAYESAVIRESNVTIMTPGILDRPLWMSSELGKFIGQFKSFGFAATNRSLIANLENMDANVLNGLLIQFTLGALTLHLKNTLSGKKTEDMETNDAIWRAVEYSGMLGMVGNIVSTLNKTAIAGGIVEDYSAMHAEHDLTSGALGPSADIPTGVFSMMRMASGTGASKDVENVRNIIPYQNLFWLRGLFDRAEAGVKSELGYE